MNIINLDTLPTEKMSSDLYGYLMEADCRGISEELPLGDTGFEAISNGITLNKNTLVRVMKNKMYFLGGHPLNGYCIKIYKIEGNNNDYL